MSAYRVRNTSPGRRLFYSAQAVQVDLEPGQSWCGDLHEDTATRWGAELEVTLVLTTEAVEVRRMDTRRSYGASASEDRGVMYEQGHSASKRPGAATIPKRPQKRARKKQW